jgi:hypothetical protein
MFEFGRELKKVLGATAGHGEPDLSLFELFDVDVLAAQGRGSDVDAGRVSAKHPFTLWIKSAALWRERARRTGDALAVRKAASAAASASVAAETPAEATRAVLEQALASLLAADLFGDLELLDAARTALKAAAAGAADEVGELKIELAHARITSRDALNAGDHARALQAAALFDCVVHRLESAASERKCGALAYEAALARIERADLLSAFGARLGDAVLLQRAEANLSALLGQVDPAYEPLLWARGAEVLGATLSAIGELEHRTDAVARGCSTIAAALEQFARDHSPLDWARLQHALALTFQTLGEIGDCRSAFAEAEKGFDQALDVLSGSSLTFRATVASNRAACLARRAERTGDLSVLSNAETAFRAEASRTDATRDPVTWAVLQMNLARVYEARADLMGGFANRDAAVYALEEAFEVFCDHGLKSLADNASAGLQRVRAA